MTMQEIIIEKLKDKNYVRAFGLMKPEEQEAYKKAKRYNCLFFSGDHGTWEDYGTVFCLGTTYAIKPNYQPEPEYVDLKIEIGRIGGEYDPRLGVEIDGKFININALPSLPNFEKFWVEDFENGNICIVAIARTMADKRKVYARLRK